MPRKNNRITFIELPVRTRHARVKGKKFFPVSITLTQEQIDWLQKQPNASEIFRKLLDDLIAAGKDVQPKLEVISLNNQLTELKRQLDKLYKEKMDYIDENKGLWKTREDPGYEPKIDFDMSEEFILWIPKPSDSEYANKKAVEYGMRIAKGYNDAMRVIKQKMADIQAKVVQS